MKALSELQKTEVRLQLLGDHHSVAQVLLSPSQSLSTDSQSVVSLSSKVTLDPDPLWKGLKGNYQQGCHRTLLSNPGPSLEFVTLGLQDGGPIVALNPTSLSTNTQEIIVRSRISRDIAYNCNFRRIKGDGLVLVQTQGLIIEKCLGDAEEIALPVTHLVSFSSNVTLKAMENTEISGKIPQMVVLKGPGMVHISHISLGRTPEANFSIWDIVMFLILM